MANELLTILEYIEQERGISRESLVRALESAILTASRKSIHPASELKVKIDPATGQSADSALASSTIIGPSGLVCDALSTAVYVMGAERASQLWRELGDFEMVLITDDGGILVTEGIACSFTPSSESAQVTVISR